MLRIRKATIEDLGFLIRVDVEDEGITHVPRRLTGAELQEYREKLTPFTAHDTHTAWVWEEESGDRVGVLMCIFRDRLHEARTEANEFLFRYVDASLLSPDGRFGEVFQLWVAPAYRRQGLAEKLIIEMETETLRRGISMIYMHTEERNPHVVDLARKRGCREIQRGPMWDDIVRVCMVKDLHPATEGGQPLAGR